MPLKYTRKSINEMVARGKPGTTRVASGLYIVVKRPMIARWLFRYQLHGKRTEITLGAYSETDKLLLSFAEAKKQVALLQAQLANGDNPKKDARLKSYLEIKTVDDLAQMYLKRKAQRIKTGHILVRQYEKDIKPAIGHIPLSKLHPLDVYETVQQILNEGRPTIANRILFLCKNIFKLGVKNQLLDSNPATNFTTNEDAGGTRPPRTIVLSQQEIGILFKVMRANPKKVPEATYIGITLLMILGMRKMELFSARWTEVDLERQMFHLRAEDTKSHRAIAIPIPERALPLFKRLKELAGHSLYLFPARKRSKHDHLSHDTVNHTLADLFGKKTSSSKASPNLLGAAGVTEFVVHDLRRTFRTLLAQLSVSEEVAESCLNHSKSKIVRIYNQYAYIEERKKAHEKVADVILPLAGYAESIQGFKRA
ncbi:tyrosine-type recombinase/integrase [Alteromonas sp. ASW11-130]|uniref:tyrosine-type recombinase/integrase n=1 Tax=Alteromonas sp. ASW11-130 TaxID=3015775 RepID=UPI002241EC7B|nr:site-specific integrase [Alteromonas sp. ASW11-130]MCW8093385.1 site-specific integrase [Alteromonas sp. ASW11-130]